MEFSEKIIVKRNIEDAFKLFDFSEKNMKILDETILYQKEEERTENFIGTKYIQGREDQKGDIFETVLVIKDFKDEEEHKRVEVFFSVGKDFDISYSYDFKKLGENETELIYSTQTIPKSFVSKIAIKFSKVAKNPNLTAHMEHIKKLIEENY